MTLERNGAVEVFTSTKPSLDVAPETHVRTVLVDRRVTRAWCEALRPSRQTDDTARKLVSAYEATVRADETFFRRRLDLTSFTECHLCNQILYGRPTREPSRVSQNPFHSLTRFQDDPRFLEDLAAVRASGVPIWLVYLPIEIEMRNGRNVLSPQQEVLLASAKEVVDRYIELTPASPMGGAALPLTHMPDDGHPSHAGLEYYAEELYRRIMPLDRPK
jgi:hypothetical protein